MEEKKIEGTIHTKFSVDCPYCGNYLDDFYDKEWWVETMGRSFPTDGVDGEYEANCPKCHKGFIIDGFRS